MKTRKPTPSLRLVDAAFMDELARKRAAGVQPKASSRPHAMRADAALLGRLTVIEDKLVRAQARARSGALLHDVLSLVFLLGIFAQLGFLTGKSFF